MCSTGSVAVFLRPSDALHGGLGLISAGDVTIALSNSGETDEILALLPTLRRHKRSPDHCDRGERNVDPCETIRMSFSTPRSIRRRAR